MPRPPSSDLLSRLYLARLMARLGRLLGEPMEAESLLPQKDVDSLGPDWLKATTEDLLPDLPGTEDSRWRHSQAGESEEQ